MAHAKQYIFPFKELATLMVKAQSIHEGHWGIYLEFRFTATNVAVEAEKLLPTAMAMVDSIGLQRFDEISPLTVDAAEVNPRTAK